MTKPSSNTKKVMGLLRVKKVDLSPTSILFSSLKAFQVIKMYIGIIIREAPKYKSQ